MSSPHGRVVVRGPAALIAVIPHLLGFHPENSLVIVGVGGPHARIRLAFRYDLPDPPDPAAAAAIADHAVSVLHREHLTITMAVGYGPGTLVTPVTDVIRHVLPREGIRLQDAIRVHERRFWSYLCGDPACCPADGVPVTPPGVHPASAQLIGMGATAAASRDVIAASIAPLTGPDAEAVLEAAGQAWQEAGDQVGAGGEEGLEAFWIENVRQAIGTYRDGGRVTDLLVFARLALALTVMPVRDDAWARMLPEHYEAHIRLWTDVTRHATLGYAAAPASLLAFTAWQAGDGALGNLAVERALADTPGYSMALLILSALKAGLPPSAAVLTMTPEEVAASYHAGRR